MTKFSTLSYTINQAHPPPPPPALFISNTFEGGLLEREDLFNLAKTMVSGIHKKLGCKVEKLKDNGWRLCSRNARDKNILDQSIQSFTVIHCNWLIKSIYQWKIIRRRGGGLINLLSLKREGLLEGGGGGLAGDLWYIKPKKVPLLDRASPYI